MECSSSLARWEESPLPAAYFSGVILNVWVYAGKGDPLAMDSVSEMLELVQSALTLRKDRMNF